MLVCKMIIVKEQQRQGSQMRCPRSPPSVERHRDQGMTPLSCQRSIKGNEWVQASRTTDLQPHPSPSKTQLNSGIITDARNPKPASRPPHPTSSPAPLYSPPPPHSKMHLGSATIIVSNPPAKTRDQKPLPYPSLTISYPTYSTVAV